MKAYTRWGLAILGLYFLLATVHSVVNPICETSDEFWHAGFAVHLARGGGLPVQRAGEETPWRQEGSQPPLYYWTLAQVARLLRLPVHDFERACPRNPHAYLGDATRIANRNLALHGPWQAFPWQGTVLTLHLWRWISVLLGAVAVLGVMGTARTLFPDRPHWALAGGAFVAFNPMFLFITSGITNDALINALAAITLWHAARVWRQGSTRRRAVVSGLLLAAAAEAKLSGLTLWPVVLAAHLLAAPRQGWRHAAPALSLGLLLGGWWYVRNWLLYQDPTGLNAMLDIVGRRTATWQDLLNEWEGFRRSFWGVFGGMNVLFPGWLYVWWDAWTLLATVGFLVYVGTLIRRRAWSELVLWAALAGYVLLVFAGLVRWTMQTLASQGRLMFPALAPIALIFWAGWETITGVVRPTALRQAVRWAPLGLLAAAAALAPFLWIAPAYDPGRARISAMPATATTLDVRFDDVVRMLGYDLAPEGPLQPGDTVQVTLYLERLSRRDRDWSLFVHLVDDVGIILNQEDRYPLLGLQAMTAIPPGTRWAEPVRLRVPDTAVTPATLHLQLGFYDLRTMERLPVQGPEGVAFRDHVRLGRWTLRARPGPYPNPTMYVFGGRAALVGFDARPRVLRPGETLTLTLYWQALGPLDRDYTVFTHVLEPPQTIWGQHDKAPDVPTSRWKAGEVYRETYTLTLKPQTPPGFYDVEIGWYDPQTGERLRLDTGQTFLILTRIRVVP